MGPSGSSNFYTVKIGVFMGGRPRKPTALHLIEGTARKDRMKAIENEPVVPIGVGECPEWVCQEGRVAFDRLSKLLVDVGVLTFSDTDGLATYCDLYGRMVELRRAGDTVPIGIYSELRQLSNTLGLNPASRARVQSAKPSDWMDDLLGPPA